MESQFQRKTPNLPNRDGSGKIGRTVMVIKHYSFNGMTIALRRGGVLCYTHTDHLGFAEGEEERGRR